MYSIIGEIASHDPLLALEIADRYPEMPWFAKQALTLLAEIDPEAAFERAGERFRNGRLGFNAMEDISKKWAAVDSEAALAKIQAFTGPTADRNKLLKSALLSMLTEHPEAVERHMDKMPTSQLRFEVFSALAERNARENPQAAMEWAVALPEGSERKVALFAAISAASDGAPERVIELLNETGWDNLSAATAQSDQRIEWGKSSELFGSSNFGGLAGLAVKALTQIAKTDPKRALALVSNLPGAGYGSDNSPRFNALTSIGREWFNTAPQEFFDWLPSAPKSAMTQLTETVVSNATGEQLDWMLENRPQFASDSLTSTFEERLAQRMIQQDPASALAVADKVNGQAQDYALLSATLSKANEDMAEALPLLDTIPPGNFRNIAVSQLVRLMGNTSFEDASAWFGQLDEADLSPDAYGAMTEVWYGADPAAVAEWILDMPPGDIRDKSATTLAKQLLRGEEPDYPAAAAWVGMIQSESEQDWVKKSVYHQWMKEDYGAATEALKSSSLTESLKKAILYER